MGLSRRDLLKLLGYAAIGGSTTLVAGYEYGKQVEAKRLEIERVRIPVSNLKAAFQGFKIVQLSDIHLYPYTQLDFVQKAVTIANGLQPDLIVLTGDYVLQTAEAIFDLTPVLATLNARYGVFRYSGQSRFVGRCQGCPLGVCRTRLAPVGK